MIAILASVMAASADHTRETVDSEPNIRNKSSRGKFTAVFLIQCLEAIGASSLWPLDG